MQGHLDRNKKMRKLWDKYGINPDTELTVNFHFYAPYSASLERLIFSFDKCPTPL
jgi:hypothetical protein